MRILLFSSTYAPRAGGVETVTRHLARGLRDCGHEVLVVTNRYPRTLPAREAIDGVPVVRRFYPNVLPASPQHARHGPRLSVALAWIRRAALLPFAPVALLRLCLLMRRFRPDVVNVHYFSYPAVYGLLAARLCRVPAVLSCHGSDVPAVPYPAGRLGPFRLACRFAAAFTVCSRDIGSYLEPILADQKHAPVWVGYSGVGTRTHAHQPPPPSDTVLVVGRLVEKKGIDVAIHAVAMLRQRGRAISLVIAGNGPLRSELELLSRDLGIAEHVTFVGQASSAEVEALMTTSSLLLVPSRWEAFGIVALEAMASGRAVVASRAGGLTEIVVDGETGLMFDPGDVASCAGAVEHALASPALTETLGRGGRERAARIFSWDGMVSSYLSAFDAALTTARSSARMPTAV